MTAGMSPTPDLLLLDGPGMPSEPSEPEWASLIQRLYSLSGAGTKLGLDRIVGGLDALGRPQDQLRCIQIAGTNGKGSTASFLGSILAHSGAGPIGLNTSPHLSCLSERIRFFDPTMRAISRAELCEIVEGIEARLPDLGGMSFFEVVTAAALTAFARREVAFAVLEAGLGARLDATSVVDPEVSIVTQISFDHCRVLGSTLEAIAREKAHTIRKGRPVVVADLAPDAARAVRGARRKARGADVLRRPAGLPCAASNDGRVHVRARRASDPGRSASFARTAPR